MVYNNDDKRQHCKHRGCTPNNKNVGMWKLGLEDLKCALKTVRVKGRFNAIIKILQVVRRYDHY